eukprot:TRINITY_DN1419_c0_g1_i10.p1 TRINITY_DN1419_c0_g1~~TRINITY_DN1419_c0_g1_i10.p1  ORF type:complete len:366 (-),score=117.86 TRINITY_DN1419_c0_g1_i10:300-1283(-)
MATAAPAGTVGRPAPTRARGGAPTSGSLLEEMCFPGVARDGPALRGAKVTIVGCGSVGMACANAILSAGMASTMVFADVDQKKVKGEVMDFVHGGAFLHANVKAAEPNFDGSEGSDIIVITAGARQRPGESRLALVSRNAAIFQSIIPPLVQRSPATLLLIVSNPVDILTSFAARLAGLPPGRVFGSGTYLDSSRLRVALAAELAVSPQSVHAVILGEHGDSSVAVSSVANVAGARFSDIRMSDAQWADLHGRVIGAAATVISLKGYTNWGVGAAVGALVGYILRDEKRVVPVSVTAKGMYGIEEDVYLSLPSVLGRGGSSASSGCR